MSEGAPRPKSIRRNAALSLGAEITAGVCTAVLTLYLVRKLGPDAFGVFSVALSIGGLILLPTDFGLSQSAARFMAEERGSRAAMSKIFGDALRVKLVAAALAGALLFGLSGPIASLYGLPELTWPLRAMAFAIFVQSIFGLVRAGFESMGQMGADWIVVTGESITETLGSIALVALGAGAAGAVWGRTIGYGCGVLLGLFFVVRLLGAGLLRPQRIDRAFARRLAGYGFALLVIDGVYAAFAQIDVLLVGAIRGSDAAGIFAAPLRLTTLVLYPAAALTAAIAPRMARGNEEAPNVAALRSGISLLLLLHLLAIAPLLVWAGPLVDLVLGSGYGEAADVLRALTPFILLAGPARLLTTSVNYLGEARRRIAIVLAALALNIAIDVVLIHRIGVVGAAIGNDVAFALYAFGHLYVCRQATGLPLGPLAKSLVRGLLAAGAMSAVLLAIGSGSVGVPLIAIGLALGTMVFFLTLWLLREPILAELSEGLPTSIRRRLPFGPGQ